MDASIIVTVYNNWTTLRETLCVLSQEVDVRFEVIVADDGSSDETHEGVALFRRTSPFPIRHVWQADKGFCAAQIRNLALAGAQGRIVVFLDGDVIPSHGSIGAHLIAHEGKSNHIVVGSRYWYGPISQQEFISKKRKDRVGTNVIEKLPKSKDAKRRERRERGFRRNAFNSTDLWKTFYTGHSSVTNEKCVRFDERYIGWGGEDWDLALRLVCQNEWSLAYYEDIESSHVEILGHVWNPKRGMLKSHDIELFLRNLCRLAATWTAARESNVLAPFRRYSFSEIEQKWQIHELRPGEAHLVSNAKIIRQIEKSPLVDSKEGQDLLLILKSKDSS